MLLTYLKYEVSFTSTEANNAIALFVRNSVYIILAGSILYVVAGARIGTVLTFVALVLSGLYISVSSGSFADPTTTTIINGIGISDRQMRKKTKVN